MKRHKIFRKNCFFLAMMLVFAFCFSVQSALASELTGDTAAGDMAAGDTAAGNTATDGTISGGALSGLTVQLTETASTKPSQVIIHAVLPEYTNCDYDIYRAKKDPEQGGKFEYLDSICEYGHTWKISGKYLYTAGPEKKVVCYKYGEMAGGVLFIDTYATVGKTYWYQIVLRDNRSDETIASNIISGQSVLAVPRVKKCYAVSSSSAKLVWQHMSKAKGYEIYRKTDSGSWKRIKTIRDGRLTSYKDKKLKAGKTYQYKMRSYRKVNGTKCYSKFSDVYKVTTKKPSVKGSYKTGSVYGPSLSSSKLTQVRRVVQSFKDNYIKKGMTKYEKLWTAFCYLRDNCSYADSWQKNGANTAWGALVYGEAQCSGYARAMKALCDAIGISCRYVHANSKAVNPSHQWVQVKLDGKWYIVDAQGGFFLVGSNTWKDYVGMSWNTKNLPKVSSKDHERGGFVSSEM